MDGDLFSEPQLGLADDPEGLLPAQADLPAVPEECRGVQRLCVAVLGDALLRGQMSRMERRRVREWINAPWGSPGLRFPLPFGMLCQVLCLDVDRMVAAVRARFDLCDAGERIRVQRFQYVGHQGLSTGKAVAA